MKKHLVMLHGFGCDSRIFNSIASKLSKDYDPVIVDLPGHGQTKGDFGDFSFCAFTLHNVLDQYLKEPYHLLGWSMGGQIALEMYKQNPKSIESLILICSTPKFVESDDCKFGMNKAVFSKFKKGLKDKLGRTIDDFYCLIFADNEDGSRFMGGLKKQTPSQETLLACMESFDRFDESSILPEVTVPTLIISGDSDRIVDPKASIFMSQEIKGSAIISLSSTGHAPHLTREAEVLDEIRKFLG